MSSRASDEQRVARVARRMELLVAETQRRSQEADHSAQRLRKVVEELRKAVGDEHVQRR